MLYIEDFKKAYSNSKAMTILEEKIEELEVKRDNAKGQYIKERIDAKMDVFKYQIGMLYGSQTEIEDFIKSIDDPYVMQIFHTRFLEGKSWLEVAALCSCGAHANEAVRKSVERYWKIKGITHRPEEVRI